MSSLEAAGEKSHYWTHLPGWNKAWPSTESLLTPTAMLSHVFCLHLVRDWLVLQLLLLLGDPNNIAPFCPTTVSTECPNTAGGQHPFASAWPYFPSLPLLLPTYLTIHQFLPFQSFAGWHWVKEASALASLWLARPPQHLWAAAHQPAWVRQGVCLPHRANPAQLPWSRCLCGGTHWNSLTAIDQATRWGHGQCQVTACLRKHG